MPHPIPVVPRIHAVTKVRHAISSPHGMEIEKDEYLHDLFTNSPKPVIHP
jgi:hypothetical protein